MAKSVKDRVKKFRARKSVTAEGVEELRAKNRLYAKRSRSKKILKQLHADLAKTKSEAASVLSVSDLHEIDQFVKQHSDNLIKITYNGRSLASDEKVDVETKIVKHEISMLLKMSEGTRKEDQLQRQNSVPARLEIVPSSLGNEDKAISLEWAASPQAAEAAETEVGALHLFGRTSNQQLLRQDTAPVIHTSQLDLEPDPFIPSSHSDLELLPLAPAPATSMNELDFMSFNPLQHDELQSDEDIVAALSLSVFDFSPFADNNNTFLDEIGGDTDIFNDPTSYSLVL